MDQPLTEILDISEQLELVRVFWRESVASTGLSHYASYLKYYRDQMKLLQWGNIEDEYLINNMASQSHDHLLQIVNTLSGHRNQTYADMTLLLQSLFPQNSNFKLRQSIDLALRAWMMLNVRDTNLQLHTPNTPAIQWTRDDTSLVNFVAAQFPNTSTYQPSESYLDPKLTAAFLHKACSVIFEPTFCLADHLRLDITRSPGRTYCRIFSLRNCVIDHMEAAGRALVDARVPPQPALPILPTEVLKETIWSFNQLFPPEDRDTQHFLSKIGQGLREVSLEYNEYKPDYSERPESLNDYQHWRGRMDELRRRYVAEPETLKEYVYKRRGFERQMSFYIAIGAGFFLAFAFGMVSSVTAVMSTRATLQALALQQAQPTCMKLCPA